MKNISGIMKVSISTEREEIKANRLDIMIKEKKERGNKDVVGDIAVPSRWNVTVEKGNCVI